MGFVPKRAVVFDVANQLLRWRALDEKQAMDAQERIMRLLGVSFGNDVARFGPTPTADATTHPEV